MTTCSIQPEQGASVDSSADVPVLIAQDQSQNISESPLPEEARQTLYALRLHQIELEMQNMELRRLDAELEKTRARYFAIIEDQTEMICRYLPDGRLSFVNEAYVRYFGKSRWEILNHNYIPNIPPSDIVMILECLKHITPDQPVARFDHRVIMDDGSTRWNEWTHRGVFSADGVLMETQAVGQDITQRKLTEEELTRAKHLLETTNQELQQSLLREQRLARSDGLTGLHNYRYFLELAMHELRAAIRYQQPLSILMFDADYFKCINDSVGHAAGDRVLVEITRTVAAQLRAADELARYGGDEFVILLSKTSGRDALAVAEHICDSISRLRVATEAGPISLTISAGISELQNGKHDSHDESEIRHQTEQVIEQADKALYEAKTHGRNRAVLYSDHMRQSEQ